MLAGTAAGPDAKRVNVWLNVTTEILPLPILVRNSPFIAMGVGVLSLREPAATNNVNVSLPEDVLCYRMEGVGGEKKG